MQETKGNSSLKNKILNSIREGRARMKPRWVFIFRAATLSISAIIIFFCALFLYGFIVFSLRQNGVWFVPFLSPRGFLFFLQSLPWAPITILIGLAVGLDIIIRRHSFAYRRPVIYSLLALTIFIIIGEHFTSPLHKKLFRGAREGRLPFAGVFYKRYAMRPFGEIFKGEITEITKDGLRINEIRGGNLTIKFLKPRAPFPNRQPIGNFIVVFGRKQSSSTILAEGMKIIDMDMINFPPPPRMK